MALPTKFTPKNSPKGWVINVPAKYTASGNRERRYFRSREAALEAARDLRKDRDQHGAAALQIPPSLAENAIAAAKVLEPFGISILEAANRIAAQETAAARSSDLSHALEMFQARKADRSEGQLRAYHYMSRDLLEDFGNRLLVSIKGGELEKHVAKRTRGPAAFNHRRRLISAFWKWCARKPRHWCSAEVLEHIEMREVTRGPIGTLTAAQAKKLLQVAEKHYPSIVPAFAILLFTGLRAAELARLKPSDVTEEGITVSAGISKTNRRRFIHMPPPLAAWLEAYPIGESVCPSNWERLERSARRRAGWRVWSPDTEPHSPPDDLPKWPHNAFRHTAATMAVALGKPIEVLVFEHGHSGGLEVLRSHYVGQMTKKEALAIWTLRPAGTGCPHRPCIEPASG